MSTTTHIKFRFLVGLNIQDIDISCLLWHTSTMDQDRKRKLQSFLQERIAQTDFKVRAYVFDENNIKNPSRNCFVKINMFLKNFIKGDTAVRWITMPGFRGVGKTTLLSQLYYELTDPEIYKLFLSVDQIIQSQGVRLEDVLTTYEEIIGVAFERLEKPLILFLDEVQYDKSWGLTLKTLFDRTNKVFIIATGSSALSLHTNPDIARRTIIQKLYPMTFTEYMRVKENRPQITGLSSNIYRAIFRSSSAEEVYLSLKRLEPTVRRYWLGIERLEIERYMRYGTLPFAVRLKNEGLVYDQIKKIIDRIITTDIAEHGQFKTEIMARIPEVLYSISSSDGLSVVNLAKDLNMNRETLTDILSVLEKTETIVRIYPYGAHTTQVRKPSKYLFASPAFRSMYFNFIGSTIDPANYMGHLLEDTVGLYLSKYIIEKKGQIAYDASLGGADFVLSFGGQKIIMEVGMGEKGFRQVYSSSTKIKANYGLAISMAPLKIDDKKFAVTVPLSYFLLL